MLERAIWLVISTAVGYWIAGWKGAVGVFVALNIIGLLEKNH